MKPSNTKSLEKFLSRMKPLIPKGEWEDFVESVTKPLDRTIRIPKFSSPQVLKLSKNWTLTPVKGIDEAFLIDRSDRDQVPLGKTFPHFNGQIYSQTLSSMLPVLALDPQPGEKILDVCAAPGSKSTFLAERMSHTGVLITNEMSASRIKKLVANLNRMQVLNTCITQIDGQKLDLWYGQEFDKILLDAPCTSEGHGRKDARFFTKTWHEKAIPKSARLQKKLIEQAFLVLKEGGEMVYSTCTMAKEENEEVIAWLVEKYSDYLEILPHHLPKEIPWREGLAVPSSFSTRKPEVRENKVSLHKSVPSAYAFEDEALVDDEIRRFSCRIWPHHETKTFSSEAFYLCKIRKTRALSRPNPVRKGELHTDFQILAKNEQAETITRLHKKWGLPKNLFEDYKLIEKRGALFMVNKDTLDFAKKNKVQRLGFKVLDEYKLLSSEFAISFGHNVNKNIIQIDEKDRERWMRGEDLLNTSIDTQKNSEGPKDGSNEVLVKHGDQVLGTGKWIPQEGKLKNKLDRNLLWG